MGNATEGRSLCADDKTATVSRDCVNWFRYRGGDYPQRHTEVPLSLCDRLDSRPAIILLSISALK